MRVLLVLLVLALLAWKLMPASEPLAVEDTVIGEPLQRLEDAKQFEADYLDEAEARKRRLEEAVEGKDPP